MDGTEITYAGAKDWVDIMKNRSKLRMHELIERLGLRAKWSSNKRGKTNFESPLVRELVADMSEVVATLPKESDELVRFLAEPGSLKEQVEDLLQKHGASIWGRVGDRDHLISAGEPDVEAYLYPRDLYFENEEDRELIRVLLHWWIGLKACNVILARERLDRERKKKEENRKARFEHENPHEATPPTFVALAPTRHVQVFQLDASTSRGSPISPSMLTPPESSESPIVPARAMTNGDNGSFAAVNPANAPGHSIVESVWNRLSSGSANGVASHASSRAAIHVHPHQGPQAAITASPQPAARQLGSELASLVANFPSQDRANGWGASASAITPQPSLEELPRHNRGLDTDTLRALRAYIYYEGAEAHSVDEDALLQRLEAAWRDHVRTDQHRIMQDPALFIARERAFMTWIELKRHLADLDRADKRWRNEGSSAPEIERRIAQHRTLMGATQQLILNWQDIGPGVDKDELLRQAFVVLAGEKYAVEMQWKSVEFSGTVSWLSEHLESFREDEKREGDGLYYLGRV
ncbi:hypothetical protein BS50DRAFT_494499 [Corynespora cassiicola Philippines]|uniref:Uncharacterized protein n=1 Tax=Corynespora cassiicola Philippines TaxID=1448308 RepID=A0A2T2NPA8_CORCC|nr:hypothetical protein BS50DRAFT_494499 [Corynespora cassiicola Philippines]